MKNSNLAGSLAISMLLFAGCSSSDKYCCDNNDLCVPVKGKSTSCSPETCGECITVDPIQISSQILPGAIVGQDDYNVELVASGGIPPYTFTLTRGDENKLKWLTITKDGDDKVIIHNNIGTNTAILYPSEVSDGITLTINVLDSSKHGIAQREDNQGKPFHMTINIKDCPHRCKRVNDLDDNPTANEGETKCEDNKLFTCTSINLSTEGGNCVKWDDGTVCMCQNDKINCCSGENICSQQYDAWCKENVDGSNAYVYTCKEDSSSGCLVWDDSSRIKCPKNLCAADGKSCGDCTSGCTLGLSECVDTTTMRTCGLDQNGCPVWTTILCNNTKVCLDGTCKCQGCWDGYQCQPGTELNICGTGGVDCFACQDIPNSKCMPTSCTDGQCVYRYTIQTNYTSGLLEVLDATTGLFWKRTEESGLYSLTPGISRCTNILPNNTYHLPIISELESIIESHGAPTINSCAFPSTTAGIFWSQTLGCPRPLCDDNYYDVVDFATGKSLLYSDASLHVRCVRN